MHKNDNQRLTEYLSVARIIVGDEELLNFLASGLSTDDSIARINTSQTQTNSNFFNQRNSGYFIDIKVLNKPRFINQISYILISNF